MDVVFAGDEGDEEGGEARDDVAVVSVCAGALACRQLRSTCFFFVGLVVAVVLSLSLQLSSLLLLSLLLLLLLLLLLVVSCNTANWYLGFSAREREWPLCAKTTSEIKEN